MPVAGGGAVPGAGYSTPKVAPTPAPARVPVRRRGAVVVDTPAAEAERAATDAAAADTQRVQDAATTTADRTGTQAQTPVVDTAAQDEARRRQIESLDLLKNAATGATPSVAEAQMNAAMNRAAQQQMGVAAQGRGGDAMAMQREAMLGIGQQGLEAGASGAAARAEEMTGARTALASAVTDTRGQDITLATDVARIEADISTINAQIASALAGGDRDAATALLQTREQLSTQLEISKKELELKKYGLDLQAEIDRAGLRQEWEIAKKTNNTNRLNGIIQGIATLGGAAIQKSDERIKTDVSKVGDDELSQFANKVAESIFSYERKDTGAHEAGTMAQDVAAAGRLGQEVTGEAAPGVKGVDYGRLATLMAAAALRASKDRT